MEKKLAIKGHLTRGKEVIELLEMMGGSNFHKYVGNNDETLYYIDDRNNIDYDWTLWDNNRYTIFTLEKFLEKYPFKVGDKVFLYDNITEGCVTGMEWDEDKGTVKYCVYTSAEYWCDVKELLKWNKALTNKETDDIKSGNSKRERTHEDVIFDSIIWHLRNSVNNGKQNLSGGECEDYFREVVKKNNENKMKNVLAELLDHIKTTPTEELEREFEEIKEWSNVGPTVEEFRTFCECVNKKPVYPKTYAECCEKLGIEEDLRFVYEDIDGNHINSACISNYRIRGLELYRNLEKLKICRDAYWKIAGEQMGLGKPWEPDWNEETDKFTISNKCNKIYLNNTAWYAEVLSFPTAEIRDAFYENFKDLIEKCKELL